MLNNNLNNNNIYYKVAKVVSEQLNISEDKINNDSSFEKLGADELDQIEILMKIEELFNIEISDEEANKFHCVKDLVECVNKIQPKNN